MMYEYAVGLARRGHEVTVFTTDVFDGASRAQPPFEVLEGVSVRRFPNVSNSLAWRTKKYLPRRFLSALVAELQRFDAVHVTDTRTFLTAATYLVARERGIPFCLSAHGSLPASPGLRGQVKRAYDGLLVRPMLERAALLLGQTEHEQRLYVEHGGRPESVRWLPLPLDLTAADRARRGVLRERMGIPKSARVVLFVGRIHRLKGLDLLIDALKPLFSGDDSLVLAVVGRDDGQWTSLERRFRSLLDRGAVRFVGPLYGEERFAAYADADVFCLTPRHWEETSLAALEAAACGTPVVVSEQAEIPGLSAAEGGFVVPLVKETIRRALLEALDRSMVMGQNARELVRRQHASEAVVDKLESYLAEVIEQVARRS